MRIKEIMSSFDLMALIPELKRIVINKYIDNIYQLNHNTFIFKLKPDGINYLLKLEKEFI